MTDFERDWIDNASYEELLTKLRQEPVGSRWFSDDVGMYFVDKLSFKRKQLSEAERCEISKRVQWANQK